MPAGMLCLSVAIMFPIFVHPAGQVGRNWFEGLRGFLFGISIGLNLMAVVLKARARRRVEN